MPGLSVLSKHSQAHDKIGLRALVSGVLL